MDKEISFNMTIEDKEKLLKLLKASGIRHYALKLQDGSLLDLVEYEEYKILKQALNEIREKFELKIKENQDLIERLADTGSFRIGNAQSKIKDYQEFSQIIDKYTKEDD